jgi:SAM-dependent methyltransferase
MTDPALLEWTEQDQARHARWLGDPGGRKPRRLQPCDDTLPADQAFRLISEGTALLWRGDFQNARQLLLALQRRLDKPPRRSRARPVAADPVAAAPGAAFHAHRQVQARRAHVLGMLLVELDGGYGLALRRAPDVRQACTEAWGPPDGQAALVSLRALQGLIGAHEWRKKGVQLETAEGNLPIHPHYGVFSPVRGEYVDLVAQAPLPAALHAQAQAFDIGVGTGVLSAVLARRGVARVVATDLSDRALACAQDNLQRLGLLGQVRLVRANLFPEGQAALVVCNPPWLPARPTSTLEQAVYDEDSRMLRGFLDGLAAHLLPGGEGWLILSDLAEHLGLRSRQSLLGWIEAAGLVVLGVLQTRPVHARAQDRSDPLHAARAAEVTALWRLGRKT